MIQKIEPHNQQQSTGGMSGGVFMLCNKTASRDRAKYLPGGRYGCVFGQPCWLTVSAWFTSSDELNGKWSIRFFCVGYVTSLKAWMWNKRFRNTDLESESTIQTLCCYQLTIYLVSLGIHISKIYSTKVQSFLNVIFVGTQLAVYLDKMFFFFMSSFHVIIS